MEEWKGTGCFYTPMATSKRQVFLFKKKKEKKKKRKREKMKNESVDPLPGSKERLWTESVTGRECFCGRVVKNTRETLSTMYGPVLGFLNGLVAIATRVGSSKISDPEKEPFFGRMERLSAASL
jgi:hypothetical protein